MKKTAITAVSLSIALLSSFPCAYAQTAYISDEISSNEEILSDFDFPEGEGISFIEEEKETAIEMPEYEDFASLSAAAETINISTVSDLNELKANMLEDPEYTVNKIFVLQNDIDLGGTEWRPLGYNPDFSIGDTEALLKTAFKGTFDGNGCTIRNFRMTDNGCVYTGFFGAVAGGTVKNLNIEDASLNYIYSAKNGIYGTGHYPVFNSLLVGFSNYATITNCSVSGSMSIKCDTAYASSRYISAGLIIGAGLAKIDKCSASGSITADTVMNTYCGGIYGNAGSSNTSFIGRISNCNSSVSINASNNSPLYAGGIIARSSTSVDRIDNCSYTKTGITASNSYASGGYTGSLSLYSGGIAGYNYSIISDCTVAAGDISVTSASSPAAGGVAGRTIKRIEDCTSGASVGVTLSDAPNSSTPSVGGIVGTCGSTYSTLDSIAPVDDEDIASIINCTVTNKASLSVKSAGSNFSVIGGIAGAANAPSKIENCVSDIKGMEVSSTLSGAYAGGICGYLNGGSAEYCKASGSAGSGFSTLRTLYLGGIAGTARTKRFLAYDTSHGVIDDEFITTKVYGSYINGCSSDMTLEGSVLSAEYIGGIAGYLSGLYSAEHLHVTMDRPLVIENSVNTGNISVLSSDAAYIGGIVGYSLDGMINDSYSIGSIECNAEDNIERHIGGAVGGIKQNNHNETEAFASMNNCYAFASTAKSDAATNTKLSSFAAEISPSSASNVAPSFTGCYYQSDDENASSENNILPLSADEFKESASFPGWNFDTLWEMTELRPQLRFEDSCLYKPVISATDTGRKITSLMVSRPQLDSSIYVASKDEYGRTTSVQVYTIDEDVFQTTAFTTIPCDIAIDGNTENQLYSWTSNNEPLTDSQSIGEYISVHVTD